MCSSGGKYISCLFFLSHVYLFCYDNKHSILEEGLGGTSGALGSGQNSAIKLLMTYFPSRDSRFLTFKWEHLNRHRVGAYFGLALGGPSEWMRPEKLSEAVSLTPEYKRETLFFREAFLLDSFVKQEVKK